MGNIKWWTIASKLRSILGRKNYSKIQSFLKYIQCFYWDYHHYGKRTEFTRQTYVFMIDGKTIHGGLSDRIRGALSLYGYCKKHNKDFKICWDYPFNLIDYLLPSFVDWKIEKRQLSFNLNDVGFKFFNSYSGLEGLMDEYYSLLDSNKREIHVYSNVFIDDNRFPVYFRDLFMPSLEVKEYIDKCNMEIGGKYISVSFRFIGLLGDFKDDLRWLKQKDEMDTNTYLKKCLLFLDKLHFEYSQYKVLVTSDSIIFLNEAKKLPYVYTIPGEIMHMDYPVANVFSVHLKTFVDYMMLSRAEKCFSYSIGNMYDNSNFARTAALIGGKEFESIKG